MRVGTLAGYGLRRFLASLERLFTDQRYLSLAIDSPAVAHTPTHFSQNLGTVYIL